MSRAATLAAAAALAALTGCLERTVTVTSEPPGAVVTMNNVEVGRTPVTTAFRYYGTYDVRLKKEGYEPVWTPMKASAPLYEYPPIDLAAEALPVDISTNLHWHFDLTAQPPSGDPAAEDALISRARDLRDQTQAK